MSAFRKIAAKTHQPKTLPKLVITSVKNRKEEALLATAYKQPHLSSQTKLSPSN